MIDVYQPKNRTRDFVLLISMYLEHAYIIWNLLNFPVKCKFCYKCKSPVIFVATVLLHDFYINISKYTLNV